MYTKNIKYKDYKGVSHEEEFMFNLNESEIMEMELDIPGGLSGMLKQIIMTDDIVRMGRLFKQIIIRSYGIVSADGRRFIKSKEIQDEFVQTKAYDWLYSTLLRDSDEAAKFVYGIIPEEYYEKVKAEAEKDTLLQNKLTQLNAASKKK